MAATGHAGTHAPQSMHSSGWMYSIDAVSNSGSSLRGWMQSTGHTSTHAVSFVPMHGSVMTNGIQVELTRKLNDCESFSECLFDEANEVGRRSTHEQA